uniref:Odorant receptor n=1 Tax=Yemma signatus TaxID=300820 RepID=A0A385H5E0_9HEMI|nr:odorant receptor [Yemma signatus]
MEDFTGKIKEFVIYLNENYGAEETRSVQSPMREIQLFSLFVGLFWNKNKRIRRIITYIIFIIVSVNFVFHTLLLVVTITTILGLSVISQQTYFVFCMYSTFTGYLIINYFIYLTIKIHETKILSIMKVTYEPLYHYELDEGWGCTLDEGSSMFHRLMRYVLVIISVLPFMFICLVQRKEFVGEMDGIDSRLPFPLWYPVTINGGFTYYTFCIAQITLVLQANTVFSIALYVHVLAVNNLHKEYRRLIDSFSQVEIRAEKRYLKIRRHRLIADRGSADLYRRTNFVKEVAACLRDNLEHQSLIKRYLDVLNEIIDVPGVVGCTFISICMAFSMAIVTGTDRDILTKGFAFLLISVITLFGHCYFSSGQIVKDLSEELFICINNFKWYQSDKRLTIYVKIMLAGNIYPWNLKACSMINCDMESFAGVLKKAYSYYNLLNVIRGRQS